MSRNLFLFGGVAVLFLLTGLMASWNQSLYILNISLVFALMSLGVNMQWGYAGLFNTGVMGFAALGGLAVALTAAPPVAAAWQAGGLGVLGGLILGAAILGLAVVLYRRMAPGRSRTLALLVVLIGGFFLFRAVFDPAVTAVEAINPSVSGNLGGLGLPLLFAWPLGGLLAAAAAWAIGKTALGLRSDYLAIATLGIAEIVVAVMKNEDWLARGVKMVNLSERPWPVPFEVDLQRTAWFTDMAANWGFDPVTGSSIFVKLCYTALIAVVLVSIVFLSERALNSPWGRMMRAIRDNEISAAAMGKDVTRRHLHVFILGSAVIGVAGAIFVSMDGILNPGTYQPLRFTFLIWVMVIVGGSGNNWGAVLGALLIGWLYLIVEQVGPNIMGAITAGLPEGALKAHLVDSAQHMRLLTLGVILLLVLRFSPRGLLPEK
ncbi:amino acid/amide ABC transporter membrane protein 2, HAAT family [Gemmobacter aquatilis]|uniref:Amino acid/amide ABC transporter membrane protein 2, HAAT family n=1 Tax=Gemmobacter aquatilis TaxID=933059 RepID=A0A1H8B6C3_9RHOB|nr:branched-chain amino acid ABC transporter permease [Gemmobacter aquatilis]SEM78303.1 amino acid/amide ABC transporter membrane protein 2, HAAT family [Gemmobacter aquatilis]